jgi:hypothetical protein
MPKCRVAFADALARLLFDKPLADLDRSERAELNFLRALDADAADEDRYEELASESSESSGKTIH